MDMVSLVMAVIPTEAAQSKHPISAGFTAVSAGNYYSLGLKSDGTVGVG